jgi:hypothetical protein
MKVSTLTRWLPAAVLAAGIAIPAAQAGRPASVQLDPAIAAALTRQAGSTPGVSLDPAISAAITSRPATVAFDGASPDRLDAYYAAKRTRASGGAPVARLFAVAPPDRLDAYLTAQRSRASRLFVNAPPDRLDAYLATNLSSSHVVTSKTGFDWADAGIGFGTAFALALVALLVGIGFRHKITEGRTIQHLPV